MKSIKMNMKPILRAIYITDTHLRASNPRSRIDDYPQVILDKIKWILDYAKKREVDVILHGGDFFDGYDVAKSIETALLKLLCNSTIPIITTIGSHDIHGYSTTTINRSSIGILKAAEHIIVLDYGEVFRWGNIIVVGCPHSLDLDKDSGNYFIDEDVIQDTREYTILLAHGNLVDHELPEGFDCTLLDDVEVNADLVLSGHYHPGYGIYRRKDGVTFVNPGSVARVKATPDNRRRKPSIAYIEVFKDAPVSVDIVPIKVAKQGDEVFADEVLIEEPPDNDVAKLVEHLRQQTDQVRGSFDIRHAIETLPLEGDVEIVKEARKRALTIIQEVEGS